MYVCHCYTALFTGWEILSPSLCLSLSVHPPPLCLCLSLSLSLCLSLSVSLSFSLSVSPRPPLPPSLRTCRDEGIAFLRIPAREMGCPAAVLSASVASKSTRQSSLPALTSSACKAAKLSRNVSPACNFKKGGSQTCQFKLKGDSEYNLSAVSIFKSLGSTSFVRLS